ncbi:hypothetical protein AVEN_73196-1 [Araneus ventricosus]|uniref:Uncharacterized protein n=1 Tax=Araneus ventricosus TaxID=182803 RepID=A0A4Y2K8X6_ARAVE|nr:hypothetical protein AVEN_73196-1 [Araneus ventricosus]
MTSWFILRWAKRQDSINGRQQKKGHNRRTHKLGLPEVKKVLAAVRRLDRFGISDRAGAAIVSAALQDVGIISESNVLNVVDRNKIRRGRTKARTTLLSQVIKDYDHDQLVYTSMGEKTGLYQWKTAEERS